MTNNAITSSLRSGAKGTYHGLPAHFMVPTTFEAGTITTGPIFDTGETLVLGNVLISVDPSPLAVKPSGTLTVTTATTLNTLVTVKGVTNITGTVNITGPVNVTGTVTATAFSGTINVQPWKSFDIRHPNRDGWRLRHVCVEGPEAAVYIRGKLDGDNIIKLPDYWDGLVDYESITVNLTPYDRPDDTMYVKAIRRDPDHHIIVASEKHLRNIKAFYTVTAARLGEMVVEYEGQTVDDFPGDTTNFTYQG